MGRVKRVVIVGLPRFAAKLTSQLREYEPRLRFDTFDTYYSTLDKLKVIPAIFRADVVYSINGSITRSHVFDLAMLFRKKLVMHWVGTDVLKALEAYGKDSYNQAYIDYAEHWCEVEWIRNELTAMTINAVIQNFAGFVQRGPVPGKPAEFNVLSYLHPNREEFYGIRELITCAKAFPDVPFYLTGTSGFKENMPPNIKFFGWVNNLNEMIANAGICIRFPQHDGLSSFVLESLSLGKQVAYKYAYPYCIHCKTTDELIEAIRKTKNDYEADRWEVNGDAVTFIREEFSREKIFQGLLNRLGVL